MEKGENKMFGRKKEKEEERLAYEISHEQEEILNLKQNQQELQHQAANLARAECQMPRDIPGRKGLLLLAIAGFLVCSR